MTKLVVDDVLAVWEKAFHSNSFFEACPSALDVRSHRRGEEVHEERTNHGAAVGQV